jgi:thymidine kinase
MKTICRCGKKAIFNARLGDAGIVREGEQVVIDGDNVRYEALCGRCYLEGTAS